MRRCVLLHAVLAALAAVPWHASASAQPLTGDDLLQRLAEPAAAAAPLPEGARVVQRSSHEREGGNRDWGVWSGERPATFVRREEGGYVLLDEHRPGCLARMWFTAGAFLGDMKGAGRLQLFFDGEAQPRVDVDAAEFFAGRVPGFPRPLVGDANSSSGGFYSYVPFCFRRSLKVRVSSIPDEQLWYQLTELVLPHGTDVQTFDPRALRARAAARTLTRAGRPPAGRPAVTQRLLAPGDRMALVKRGGTGSIRHLRFSVVPFLPETLSGLELRVTADGADEPQLTVPLDVLFGDGLGIRPIRSVAFGMNPVTSQGYFSLPIPFEEGVSAELHATVPSLVRAETWLGKALPGAGTLHARRTVDRSRRGLDLTALATGGSGRLAAWVLDLVGERGSNLGPLQFILEGDERVHVDGSPSCSIYGTGTEDAFNGGFYYNRGPFSSPTHGAGLFLSRGITRAARSQYRVFGGDGYLWENGIRFGVEHGGGDEKDDRVGASTAFWYAHPARLHRTDELLPADPASAAAHRLRGQRQLRTLTAYFEGERDGNVADSTEPLLFGGTEYPAPPPEESPEGVTASGVEFTSPLSFDLAVGRRNCGVVLRRLLDAAAPSRVEVAVDGRSVGPWVVAEANPSKRWLSDDFQLPPARTAGRRHIRVTLTPAEGTAATAFRLEALPRTLPACDG